MTMDFTRLIDRLDPPADGETPVRHRTGTVAAVNSDGTIDVNLGGVVVPGVQTLMSTTVGAVVQVLVWKGDLLALGTAGRLGVLGYNERTTATGSFSSDTVISNTSVEVTLSTTRQLRISGFAGFFGSATDVEARLRLMLDASQIQRDHTGLLSTVASRSRGKMLVAHQTLAAGTYVFSLRAERVSASGTITVQAAATAPAFVLVEDIGPG